MTAARLAVLAIMPTFCPASDLATNVDAIRSQADLVVIDDGSVGETVDRLRELEIAGVEVVFSRENRGIAHALNRGVELALERGYEYVMTIDQDSGIDPGYIALAVAVLDERTAFAYPELINGQPQPRLRFGHELLARDPLQSAMVIPTWVFRKVGLFYEPLFIDCVDVEFNLRVISRGLRSRAVARTNLRHGLGSTTAMRDGREYSIHPPWRRRYIIRNRLHLYRKFMWRYPRWVLHSFLEEARMSYRLLTSSPDKREHGRAIVNGVRDALKGRLGRIDGTVSGGS